RPLSNGKLLVDQTLICHAHRAARNTQLCRQVPPGWQSRAGNQPPGLDGLSDRPIDLSGQGRSFRAIEGDRKVSHSTMVQSKLPILVLFNDQDGVHLLITALVFWCSPMNRSLMIGIVAALFAAFAWSLNFVVPFVIGDYSVFDFALFRFGISGMLGLGFLLWKWDTIRGLSVSDWLVAFRLGFIGYLGYFLAVASAAIFAGPVIAPAFL